MMHILCDSAWIAGLDYDGDDHDDNDDDKNDENCKRNTHKMENESFEIIDLLH